MTMRRTCRAMTWRWVAATLPLLAGALPLGCNGAESGAETGRAPGATAQAVDSAGLLADRAMEALGGEEAWKRTRFLAFTWVVARGDRSVKRSHAWDRYTGRYRLEYDSRDGKHLTLFNVNEVRPDSALGKVPSGEAWVQGKPLAGAGLDSALARGYATFINDTYWLLMPYKWRDPGVHLVYEGLRKLADGREYPVLHLTFEPDLGVTEDQYWAFVDPETGLMAAWRYHLQNQEEPGSLIWWKDWRQVGPIKLATDRRWPEGDTRIYFENLRADSIVPEELFSPSTP
ncbi:MAG: hypothetical protein ACE5HQ_01220 [Gemmatimonadota bacterium]